VYSSYLQCSNTAAELHQAASLLISLLDSTATGAAAVPPFASASRTIAFATVAVGICSNSIAAQHTHIKYTRSTTVQMQPKYTCRSSALQVQHFNAVLSWHLVVLAALMSINVCTYRSCDPAEDLLIKPSLFTTPQQPWLPY
jgi:hypothetical protein